MPEVFMRTLQSWRRWLQGWLVAVAVYLLCAAGLFPLTAPALTSSQLLQRLGVSAEMLANPAGWLSLVVFSLPLPLGLGFFAVELGSRLIAGDEQRGMLSLILGTPLSRWHLLLAKFSFLLASVVASALVVFCLLGLVGLFAGWPLPRLFSACLTLVLQVLFTGCLSFSIGALTGSLRTARFAGFALLLLSLALLVAPLWIPQAAAFQSISLLACSALDQPLRNGLSPLCPWLLTGLSFFLVALAWAGFQQRDLTGC